MCVSVDGSWTSWQYHPCTVACGNGTQYKTRSCTNPAPEHGGAGCNGSSLVDNIPCNELACPGKIYENLYFWYLFYQLYPGQLL